MDIYLVGGAVRDKLLGLPVHERDYVVVGATADDLLAQGFTPIGRDFPVFLHPKTHEEYALARTERKQGHGYRGFTIYAAPEVTLVEDLARRDLTINAMAMDSAEQLIDPYHGFDDLQQKCLRHVSPAFVEDPLRVLRLARFAARFAHLHFTIAPETIALAQHIAHSGELAHLQAERIWQEIHGACLTENPAVFWQTLQTIDAMKVLVPVAAWHSNWQKAEALEILNQVKDLPQPRLWCLLLLNIYGQTKEISAITEHLAQAWAIPKTLTNYAVWAISQMTALCEDALSSADTLLAWIKRLDHKRRAQRWQWLYTDLIWWQDNQGFTTTSTTLWPWLDAAIAAVSQVDPHEFISQGLAGQALAIAIQTQQLKVLTAYWRDYPLPGKPCWRQTS